MSIQQTPRDSGPAVTPRPAEWMRALLGLCTLRALEDGPSYGYAIIAEPEQACPGEVKGGTLYPVLTRYEGVGWVETERRAGTSGPDRKYFSLTLRLREVRGDAIGDAVAVVRAHVADSGHSAFTAFGDPRAYAEELELPTVQGVVWSSSSVMALEPGRVLGMAAATIAPMTAWQLRRALTDAPFHWWIPCSHRRHPNAKRGSRPCCRRCSCWPRRSSSWPSPGSPDRQRVHATPPGPPAETMGCGQCLGRSREATRPLPGPP